jgi:hypothetical protein
LAVLAEHVTPGAAQPLETLLVRTVRRLPRRGAAGMTPPTCMTNARSMIMTTIHQLPPLTSERLATKSPPRPTVDSSQFGPIYNALDGEHIRLTGLPQKKMTVTDLQAKYAWLQAINDQVRARNVPDFLDL